jgi:3-methylcrotonyl-CoA carboxylase beta subunit
MGQRSAAGAVAGIGNVSGVPCMIVANDATVKGRRIFSPDSKEDHPRPTDRLRKLAPDHLPRLILRASSSRCRTRFSR